MWFKSDRVGKVKSLDRKIRRSSSVTNVGSGKSRATVILKAMSNSQRLQILSHLMDGKERSVKELESIVKSLSQSSLSQHLGRLRRANIVKTRRDSQMVYYSIHDNTVRDIIALLTEKIQNDPMLPKSKTDNEKKSPR